MPAPVVANGTSNGHVVANGHAGQKPKSRAALRRAKAKAKAGGSQSGTDMSEAESEAESVASVSTAATSVATAIDELPALDPSDPSYAAFASVFRHFAGGDDAPAADEGPSKGKVYYSDDEDDDEEDMARAQARAAEAEGLTRRQRRAAAKLSVAELKQLVDRPEVVEWFDADARDPRLLVTLKSYRNTVPVPSHWNAKRDYLAGKRGIEKPPYLLPHTGIGEQRDAVKAKEAGQSLAQKTRERVQPKMGKIDIDYQKLHDAFFKYQEKPSMSRFGEAYYEGKEYETDLRTKKPGELSDELVEALSIPPLAPPPWLIAMQRFGPPPSYPNLRIRGLNAPIPSGAQWGFHPGGWGKPPMDEFNRPLYGDVFGVVQGAEIARQNEIDRSRWAEIEAMEAESEEEEEEDEEEEVAEDDDDHVRSDRAPADGLATPSGMATPSGVQSVVSTVPGGLETPDFIDLRKRPARDETEEPSGPRELYTVIPERETGVRGFMGSSTTYDLSGSAAAAGAGAPVLGAEDRAGAGTKRKSGDVDISLDEDGLSQAELRKRYDQARSTDKRVNVPGQHVDRSEFDDVISSETRKRTRKDDKKGKDKAEKFKF